MWTEEEVRKFVRDNPIDTQGALSEHKVTIKEVSDGDVYFRIIVPYWSQNISVVKDVLELALKAIERGNSSVFLARDHIAIFLYVSICDPD